MNRPERLLALVVSDATGLAEPPPDRLHGSAPPPSCRGWCGCRTAPWSSCRHAPRPHRAYSQTEPFLEARVEELPEVGRADHRGRGPRPQPAGHLHQDHRARPHLPDELQVAVANLDDPTTLSYLVSSSLRLSVQERQELLEESDLEARLRRLTVLVNRELELLELGAKIQSDVQEDMEQGQRASSSCASS